MRVLVGALVLLLCAWRTHDRLQDWRSDEALWRAAVETSPRLTRPMVNLAAALLPLGQYEEAWQLVQRAAPHTTPQHRRTFIRTVRWLDTVWQPVCDDPARASWCAWEPAS